ncbi:MAG: NRDE family protein [Betaproteobacteria bacterium]|nr:NRDE family protein [Betaproteobacteria bacterium]
MCIALIAHQAHPVYALIIAANRDEFHARPTAAAHWWPEDVLAGRDLVAGGTWFGVHRTGRVALLTNYRDGAARDPAARSRGELVVTALLGTRPPQRLLSDLLATGENYQGYSLIGGRPGELYCVSNRNWMVKRLPDGVSGLSNHFLDSPWPKVERAKERLREAVRAPAIDPAVLFELLRDKIQAADHELPDTGIGIERERLLSSPFIVGENYGTRSSTVLLMDRQGGVTFIERTFDPQGEPAGDVRQAFTFAPAP